VTPAGARRFLGLFGNDNISLGLTKLPPHSQARITFNRKPSKIRAGSPRLLRG
jgi:hypothetical protein